VSDLLAAICVLAIPEGHKVVMAAMSDYRVVFEEAFRFEELISSLRLPEIDSNDSAGSAAHPSEDDSSWEARTASMVLINALTNGPESLEERILLREEFSRRGLNEVIVVSARCSSLCYFHSSGVRPYAI
jgi:diaphanous 1